MTHGDPDYQRPNACPTCGRPHDSYGGVLSDGAQMMKDGKELMEDAKPLVKEGRELMEKLKSNWLFRWLAK